MELMDTPMENTLLIGRRRKWEKMLKSQTVFTKFISKYPEEVLRRAARGVPDGLRWMAWRYSVLIERESSSSVTPLPIPSVVSLPQMSPNMIEIDSRYKVSRIERDIRLDVPRTFAPTGDPFSGEPKIKFQQFLSSNGERDTLYCILMDYASSEPAVGYCQGMNFIVGLIILVLKENRMETGKIDRTRYDKCPITRSSKLYRYCNTQNQEEKEEVKQMFFCIMNDWGLHVFYEPSFTIFYEYMNLFDHCMSLLLPTVRTALVREGVHPSLYFPQWILSGFSSTLPTSTVYIVWDFLIIGSLINRNRIKNRHIPLLIVAVSLSLMESLSESLHTLDFQGMISVLSSMRKFHVDAKVRMFGQVLNKRSYDYLDELLAFRDDVKLIDYQGLDDYNLCTEERKIGTGIDPPTNGVEERITTIKYSGSTSDKKIREGIIEQNSLPTGLESISESSSNSIHRKSDSKLQGVVTSTDSGVVYLQKVNSESDGELLNGEEKILSEPEEVTTVAYVTDKDEGIFAGFDKKLEYLFEAFDKKLYS